MRESWMKYEIERLREDFARDARLGELDVEVLGEAGDGGGQGDEGSRIVIRGDIMSSEHRELLSEIAKRRFPRCQIDNQVRVIEPAGDEAREAV